VENYSRLQVLREEKLPLLENLVSEISALLLKEGCTDRISLWDVEIIDPHDSSMVSTWIHQKTVNISSYFDLELGFNGVGDYSPCNGNNLMEENRCL
jgi:hypothetical protein